MSINTANRGIFFQLNCNYILNYLQLPETISKLEINFLGTGPSRSAVKWTILCSWPPTLVSPHAASHKPGMVEPQGGAQFHDHVMGISQRDGAAIFLQLPKLQFHPGSWHVVKILCLFSFWEQATILFWILMKLFLCSRFCHLEFGAWNWVQEPQGLFLSGRCVTLVKALTCWASESLSEL